MSHPTPIELLAPARDVSIACAAIDHGADAVYMGASHHGARAEATNSLDDVRQACDYAHQFGARLYATVNTLVLDNELLAVERLIGELYRAGVDAIIVQDLGILKLDLPPIALHASTQCDIRTPHKAQWLESLGFTQLVLARELTIAEMAAIRRATVVTLECFVHGALCVSYSGRCAISQVLKGRSANRGQCAQLCRLSYNLEDEYGHTWVEDKHLLSLRDLNLCDRLESLLQAGISSLKIEGRLKDIGYVKNVVASYRQALDRIIERRPQQWQRASSGTSQYTFTPNLSKSFNRNFTHYFVDSRTPSNGTSMASINTPKSLGEYLGEVTHSQGNKLHIHTSAPLTAGDGLSFVDASGQYTGMRVNQVDGQGVVRLRCNAHLPVGTRIYRTADKAFDDLLNKPSARRTIAINATLRYTTGLLSLTLADERGNRVTHSLPCSLEPARSHQHERQVQELGKLGNTIYRLAQAQTLDNLFVPASLLAQLRRETLLLLDHAQRVTRRAASLSRTSAQQQTAIVEPPATADNIANHLARQLCIDQGIDTIHQALEAGAPIDIHTPLMHTRYCLRRQLRACLKSEHADQLPAKLYLRTGDTLLQVHCHCDRCEMTITLAHRLPAKD